MSERIDDQSLLIGKFLCDDMLEQFFRCLCPTVDEIVQFCILEEYHEQTVTTVQLSQVGKLSLQIHLPHEVCVEHEQTPFADMLVDMCVQCGEIRLAKGCLLGIERFL